MDFVLLFSPPKYLEALDVHPPSARNDIELAK